MALRESTSLADGRTNWTRPPSTTRSNVSGPTLTIGTNNYSVIIPLKGDITSQESLRAMAQSIRDEVGYINLLIANAGVTGPMLESLKKNYTLKDFVEHAWATPMEDFTSTYHTNCTALYYTVLAFLELLDEGNTRGNYMKSQVIATASTASFLRHPRAGYAYLSSKAGVISMIKALSTFCVPWGIRFNAIAAGRQYT